MLLKTALRVLFVPCLAAAGIAAYSQSVAPAPKTTHAAPKLVEYGKLPLSFEPNLGQTSSEVQWLARGPEYTLFLAGPDAVLKLSKITPATKPGERTKIDTAALRMGLLGATSAPAAHGEELQSGKANYFTGKNSSKWQQNVSLYGRVLLEKVYPGIDLAYYGHQGQLEYDFLVTPGADPSAIRMKFDGSKPTLSADGDLVLPVNGTEVRFHKPVVYQMEDGVRQPVAGSFLIAKDNQVSFTLGAYDRTRELVIDPKLVFIGTIAAGNYPYSTEASQITVDSTGAMYFIGTTNDPTYPVTSGAFQQTCGPANSTFAASGGAYCLGGSNASGSSSAYVTKISADGTTLVYSTYLSGGGGYEQGTSIAVDSTGVAYLLGATSSNDFPVTSDAFESECQPAQSPGFHPAQLPSAQCNNFGDGGGTEYTINGPVFFFAKLSADGSSLIYSSFLGGSSAAYPVATALDAAGNWYLYGQTSVYLASDLYPGSGANAVQFPGVSASGYQTVSTAYYNIVGNQYSDPEGINNAAVLSKFSNDGHTLLYGTFFGDEVNGYDFDPSSMAVGANGIVFIGGNTQANSVPTTPGTVKPNCTAPNGNPYECNTVDGFVATFDTTKSGAASLVYATRIAGSAPDVQGTGANPMQQVYGLAANSQNDLYITGHTYDQTFPVPQTGFVNSCNTFNPNNYGNCDTAFALELNPTGTAILGGSFIIGSSPSNESSIGYKAAIDSEGRPYFYGLSYDAFNIFPLVNPVQAWQLSTELYIATMSPDLTKMLFATRLGNPNLQGSNIQAINGLALDPSNNIYFAGTTFDTSFPATPGTYTTAVNSGTEAHTFFGKISPVLTVGATSLSIAPTTATTGQSVTFTVGVAEVGSTVPTGSVALSYTTPTNSTPTAFETLQLDGTGNASYSTTSLAAGTYTFTGAYSGDSNYDVSTSSAVTVTVNNPTTTTLTLSVPSSANIGASVTFTATASGSGGTPTGTVTFYDGGTALGTGTLTNGVATFVTSSLQAGQHSISATYGGDDTFGTASAAAQTLTINLLSSSVSLTVPSTAVSGTSVTFSAKVSSSSGTPTGTVTFLDGTTTLGTGSLSGGTATYSTSSLATGSHSITASYGGDSSFAAATSTAESINITAAVTASVNWSASPSSLTIDHGNSGKVVISGAPVGGFSGTASFACTGLPEGGTCSFSPTTLTFVATSSATQSTTLTISDPTMTAMLHGIQRSMVPVTALSALLLLPFGMIRRKRMGTRLSSRLASLLLCFVALSVAVGISGCNLGNQQPKTYKVTVQITDGGTTTTLTIPVTVQ